MRGPYDVGGQLADEVDLLLGEHGDARLEGGLGLLRGVHDPHALAVVAAAHGLQDDREAVALGGERGHVVGVGHDAALAQQRANTRDLRVLDVPEPLAYCLPGVRSRVVVSEGTLKTLTDAEIDAVAARIVAEVQKKSGAALRG